MAKATPKVDPNVEISAAAQKAQGLMQAGKYAEARKMFEDLLAKYPTVLQINAYIAQAYAGEKNYDKAVEHLKIAVDADPTNVEMKLLLGDILMEKGDKAEGLADPPGRGPDADQESRIPSSTRRSPSSTTARPTMRWRS